MLSISSETFVTKFWDYPLNKIDEKTLEEVKNIVAFREKVLEKVKSGEWTEKEYKQFSGVIKMMRVKNFDNFIEIANTVISMDLNECKKEVEFNSLGFDNEFKSEPHMLACLIEKIQSRLLSFGRICISDGEKDVNKELDDDIKFCEQLYSEVSNNNSDYVLTLKELYKSWVNKNIVSENLKTVVLKHEDKIVQVKRDSVRQRLQKLCVKKRKDITAQINNYHMHSVSHTKKQFKR